MIPRIIHQTWKDEYVPTNVYRQEWLDSWKNLHVGWEHYFWTDETIRTETEKHRPELLPILENKGVTRSQICRFLALEIYGGLYVDLDYECFKPLTEFLDRPFLFAYAMEGQPHVSDALMMAAPGQGFFNRVLDECLNRYNSPRYGTIEERLSFVMLTEMVQRNSLGRYVMPASKFSPFNWLKGDAIANGMTEVRKQQVLQEHPDAYAATYWTHNWRQNY